MLKKKHTNAKTEGQTGATAEPSSGTPAPLTFEEQLELDILEGELIVSVNAVAAFFRRSIRTVCDWKACHSDFPVVYGEHGVWRTCRERLERWKADHPEKFLSRQDKLDSAANDRANRRRW